MGELFHVAEGPRGGEDRGHDSFSTFYVTVFEHDSISCLSLCGCEPGGRLRAPACAPRIHCAPPIAHVPILLMSFNCAGRTAACLAPVGA